jgi:hypothetical protein
MIEAFCGPGKLFLGLKTRAIAHTLQHLRLVAGRRGRAYWAKSARCSYAFRVTPSHPLATTRHAVGALAAALLALSGCQSEATKKCHASMTSAQEIVKGVDSKDLASVERSLASVEAAMTDCNAAGRTAEYEELLKARNQLSGHAEFMKKKASAPSRPKLTAEQLAAFEKNGDPNCPKGQAYKQDKSGKEIRCVGPQVVDLPWRKAEEYFRNRGYKLSTTETPPTLKAEHGAELLVFTYAAVGSDEPPRCLSVYPAPGQSWQEATSRVTGQRPDKLTKEKPVTSGRGALPLRVEDEGESKLIVHLGSCG